MHLFPLNIYTMQANAMRLWSSPPILLNTEHRSCHHVSFRVSEKSNNPWTRRAATKKENIEIEQQLKLLWDDGYGTQTVRDYIEAAKTMIKSDGGPPRWFCPLECGPPLQNSPLLLYLPGIDGVGMGMVLHHKAIGKVFQVQCMHVPVHDRTPYKELVKFVGEAVMAEHASFPGKPIYLVGDSFGGCLALSVAAANPAQHYSVAATSFERSQLQPLLPFLEILPENLLPYLLGATLGDPMKMASVVNATNTSSDPAKQMGKLFQELSVLAAGVSNLAEILPKQTLIWKLNLLKSGAASSNLCINAIKSDVLILASGNDSMLPSKDEAQRLSNLLKNSKLRLYSDNGHILLMENGINLLTVIKGSHMYRRSKRRDVVTDFLPPSKSEFQYVFDQQMGLFRLGISPVMMSTLADGEIVRGLKGIPAEGPVLLVGYHMLLGSEISTIAEECLREKNVMVRALAHPMIFGEKMEQALQETSRFDYFKVLGAIPVSATNLCRLLSAKSHVLLYPGGVREALHRKGEAYKLFWPEEPEFVRIAAKYGATIVPFGVVGEDDVFELFFDYNDYMKIPHLRNIVKQENDNIPKVRAGTEIKGEVGEQFFYVPGFYPKLPGRFYFLFGKPMETKGRKELLTDKMRAKEFYEQVKCDVKTSMDYLLNKREEDPYRNLLDRFMYRAVSAPTHQVPTFDP